MRRDDLGEILAIERVSFHAPWPRSAFDLALAAPDLACLVADADRILGYLVGCPDEGEWLIANVAVCPDARRRGVGAELMREAIAQARARSLGGCILDVRASNHGAQRLYRALGFVEQGRRPGYYLHPLEDAITMRLSLAGAVAEGD